MKEKVCVTGADGMLGAAICRELIAQNYDVTAFVLPNRSLAVLENLEISIAYGNLLDKTSLMKAFDGCDCVIHVAASTAVWPRKSPSIMQVNFEGTMNVADVVQEKGIRRLIHIGTASSFGNGTLQVPGNEMSPYNSARFKMDYITSKYLAQEYLLEQHKTTGLPVLIINPTFMIGPYDSGPSSGKMLLALYTGKLPAYTKGGKNFVYSLDVARAAVNAIKFGNIGECYIAGNRNLSYRQFLSIACQLRKQRFNLFRAPYFFTIGIGIVSSLKARITKRPPQLSYTMARVAVIHQFYSAEKAINELNMPQTPIETAIQECVTWYESNGYLTTKN